MPRNNLNDLLAFRAVALERSFTRAAAQMGVSTSALSHAVRSLEERLGIRLLNRTTRTVVPTEAGDRLLLSVGALFDGVETELASLTELRGKPSGTIRITTSAHAARTILEPALIPLLASYPDLNVELSAESGFVDIVAERFDAGVRLGETVAQDMIAIRIGPDLRMAAAASPAYLAHRAPPLVPHDLSQHNCINLRFPTYGGLYAWEFEKDGRALNVRVDGQMTVNDTTLALQAAMDGIGIAYITDDQVLPLIADGRLVRILEDWCPPFPGYHLYYPSRRQHSSGFSALVDALRYRA
jgi:DNA-binding transcriptional LysR family regulator